MDLDEQNIVIKKLTRPTTGRPTTGKAQIIHEKNKSSTKVNIQIEEEVEEEHNINLNTIINKNIEEVRNSSANQENLIIRNNSFTTKNEEIMVRALTEENYEIDTDRVNVQRDVLEKMIIEENERIEIFNKQREKLTTINLIEKNLDGLYEWGSLFTKSRPITSYTKSNLNYKHTEESKKQLDLLETKQLNEAKKKNKTKPFAFPVALIDDNPTNSKEFFIIKKKKEKEKQILLLSRSKSKSKSKSKGKNITKEKVQTTSRTDIQSNYHHISKANRPQSVYSERKDNQIYYLDKAFSTYYTQEEKEFAHKFPLLHAKVKTNNKQIKSKIEEVKYENKKIEEIQGKLKEEKEEVVINQKDLNLAGNSKNPIPLLKSIHKQINPTDAEEPLYSNRIYPISNKPLGNSDEYYDSKVNVRSSNLHNFLSKFKRIRSANILSGNSQLILDTYDADDPDIQMFKNLEEKEEEKNENIKTINQIPELNEDEFNHDLENLILDNKNLKDTINTIKSSAFRPNTALNNKHMINSYSRRFNKSAKMMKPKPSTARLRNVVSIGTSTRTQDKTPMGPDSSQLISPPPVRIFINEIVKDNYPEYLTPKYKTIRAKLNPPSQPHAYKVMQQTKLNSLRPKSINFAYAHEDILQVKNINIDIKEDLMRTNESYSISESRDSKEINHNQKQRPKTSKDELNRPYLITEEKKKTVPKKKHVRGVTNTYFNDYIDMNFKNKNSFHLQILKK